MLVARSSEGSSGISAFLGSKKTKDTRKKTLHRNQVYEEKNWYICMRKKISCYMENQPAREQKNM